MSDEYLWNRSGPPDPEIERLERLLGRLRTTPAAPEWPAQLAPRTRVAGPLLALAAGLILACAAAIWTIGRIAEPSWSVVRVDGTPVVGARKLTGAGQLAVGELLVTDDRSRASVAVADVGRLDVAPDTRIRLVGTRDGRHRLSLDRGTVHATIWAPPGEVVVDTPASTAVDLGCAYTLSVAPDGAGVIEVEVGWVGFEFNGREAFIPAGARCATRPRVGPGTPYYDELDRSAREALAVIDFGEPDDRARRAALATVIAAAKREDAMTVWHLLTRVPTADRDQVFDALAHLVPPPAGVTREGIRNGDRVMRDRWWDALELGTSSWWRLWEHEWR